MRNIEKAMVEYIDARVVSADLNRIDASDLFVLAGEACVGIKEVGGNNDGPQVRLIQETIGGASREPWCMALVQTCIAYVEQRLNIVSRVPAGEHCMTVFRTAPHDLRCEGLPPRGSIVIWNHPGSDNGHTGIVRDANLATFKAIEGNTESGVDLKGAVVRDGGGCYRTERSMAGSPTMKVMGFLKPF